MFLVIILLVFSGLAAGFQGAAPAMAADLVKAISGSGLDPAECYRVRDLSFAKDDVKLYLNDGYLIFSKPVLGQRLSAVFTTDVEGGDGEVIILPPTRSERQSLAKFTQSPNLDEHFRAVLVVSTDGSLERLRGALDQAGSAKKAPELGAILSSLWDPVVSNISGPMQMRVVADLWAPRAGDSGMTFLAVSGKTLGNFDILSDARANHRIQVRSRVPRDSREAYNIWTDFVPRRFARQSSAAEATPQRKEFTLEHFRIAAEIADDLSLKAVTHVTLHTGTDAVRVFAFEVAQSIQVSAVRVDGMPAELMRDDSQRGRMGADTSEVEFLVVAPTALPPSSTHEFEFEHQGKVIATRGDGVYFVSARGSWYPHVGGQFATYDLSFRYPKKLTLVTAGDGTEDRTEGDVRITRRTINVAVAIAGFNLGVYEKVSGTAAGVGFDVYGNRNLEEFMRPLTALPANTPPVGFGPNRPRGARQPQGMVALVSPPEPSGRLHAVAADVAASLEFFTSRFGPPVMNTLRVTPIPGFFGQGFPGLVYLSTFAYIDPLSRPEALRNAREQTFFSDLMVPHEVAHQWWGSIIATSNTEDNWLLEALANYSSLLWLEKKKGPKEMLNVLEGYRTELLSKNTEGTVHESAGPLTWGERLDVNPNSGSWRIITYGKGTWVLHMLRRRMGDASFFKLLAELRRRFEFKSLTTGDFQALARELRPPNMKAETIDTFFDNWVYSTGIPALKLRYTVRGVAPAVKISGTVEQSGASDDFSVDVPVEIQFAKGPSQTVWVRISGEERSFTANVRLVPTKAVISPDFLAEK